jgi:glycosyltransferase involved in cell wall biosynthesis
MELSVIIPAFNSENTLKRCVDSVLAQECKQIELIIIDDGSTDSSPYICDYYSSRYDNITSIHTSNGGLSNARNKGIECAKGEYITFIDSDDYIEKFSYKVLLDILNSNKKYDILEYPIYERYGSLKKQHLLTFKNQEYTDMKEYWLGAKAYNHSYACNKIFKRKLFEQVKFPEGKAFEDIFTLQPLLKVCHSLLTTDKGLYYYTFNPNGITSKAGAKELSELLEANLNILPVMSDENYYASVLNIALDVYNATSVVPSLPILPYKGTLKLKLLNIIGLKKLCQLNKIIHKIMKINLS